MVTTFANKPAFELEINAIPGDLPATGGSIANVNSSLEGLERYIRDVAKRQLTRDSTAFNDLDEEINDLAQTALIAYWKVLSNNGYIISPKAYLNSTIRSRLIDLMRQRKHKTYLSLPVDEDGELYQGDVMLVPGEGMQDPALQFEQKEFIAEVITDVMNLPWCQRRAMVCMLKDEVGDTPGLEVEFCKQGSVLSAINWPTDPVERQSLKSSLSVARKKMRSIKSKYDAA